MSARALELKFKRGGSRYPCGANEVLNETFYLEQANIDRDDRHTESKFNQSSVDVNFPQDTQIDGGGPRKSGVPTTAIFVFPIRHARKATGICRTVRCLRRQRRVSLQLGSLPSPGFNEVAVDFSKKLN